jgi:dihydroneopterin aldolase
MNDAATKDQVHRAEAGGERLTYRVFVRDLDLPSLIGVHRHERDGRQRVRINIEVTAHLDGPLQDRLANAVCYETIVARVRRIVGAGHINLVETLAERIAEASIEDGRVASARIRVEKLDVFADAAGAGVEIERVRPRR